MLLLLAFFGLQMSFVDDVLHFLTLQHIL